MLHVLLQLSQQLRAINPAWASTESCADSTAGYSDPEIAAVLDFGFQLVRHLAEPDPIGNVFISPVGIAMTLAMAANGARGEARRAAVGTLGLGVEHANRSRGQTVRRYSCRSCLSEAPSTTWKPTSSSSPGCRTNVSASRCT